MKYEPGEKEMFIQTNRLTIRKAKESDSSLIWSLWTDPRVMADVGYPEGLRINEVEIKERIGREGREKTLLESLLIVDLRNEKISIGQCFMLRPNDKGVSSTDIKLLPKYWGRGYGLEVKRGLLDTLFTSTECLAVEATPNVNNLASIRLQESVGGIRVGEEIHEFPESMADFTRPVHCYIYRVNRPDWEAGVNTG